VTSRDSFLYYTSSVGTSWGLGAVRTAVPIPMTDIQSYVYPRVILVACVLLYWRISD